MNKLLLSLGLAVFVFTQAGLASINLGPYTFDDNAFPDAATYIAGGPPALSFPTSGNTDTDLLIAANPDLSEYIFGTPVRFQLDFVDNKIVNDAGADLVLFELGTNDAAEVSIFVNNAWTAAQTYLLTNTGYSAGGFTLNAVAINLDDFGVAALGLIESIQIYNTGAGSSTVSSSIAAVGALNSVPEPLTLMLLGVGGVAIRFKKKR